ncbi:MAG: hypothetical protein ABI178_11755 [Rhodanobacter sp.]
MPAFYRVNQYPIWNVRTDVGVSKRADRMDVKLVQFLLNKVLWWKQESGALSLAQVTGHHLAQDGIFGGQSRAALLIYQNHVAGLTPDGNVSSVRNHQTSWSAAHDWSIVCLNEDYASWRCSETGTFNMSSAMQYMPGDPEINRELGAVLSMTYLNSGGMPI